MWVVLAQGLPRGCGQAVVWGRSRLTAGLGLRVPSHAQARARRMVPVPCLMFLSIEPFMTWLLASLSDQTDRQTDTDGRHSLFLK